MSAVAREEIVAPVIPSICQSVGLRPRFDELDRVGELRSRRTPRLTSKLVKVAREVRVRFDAITQARRFATLQNPNADDRLISSEYPYINRM